MTVMIYFFEQENILTDITNKSCMKGLRQNFFETDSCLSALTSSTSHMQSCFEIDLGFIKLSNV